MVTRFFRWIAGFCFANASAVFVAPVGGAAPAMPMCVQAAAQHLDAFGFAQATLRNHCECVQRRVGELPFLAIDWIPTAPGSPALTLMACAQADMERFGYALFMEQDGPSLRDRLVPEPRIERIAQCVGRSFFEGPLRAVSEKLDKSAVRQDFQFRYDRCFQM